MRRWVRPQGHGPGQDPGEVPGPVADQGRGSPGQRGQHQLSPLAVGQHPAGLGVDDLEEEVVLPEVHAVLLGALEGDPGPAHLREAVGVVDLDAPDLLDAPPRFLGVRLGADEGGAQGQVLPGVDRRLGEERGEAQRVAGEDVHDRGAELLHEPQLPLAVARADGDRERPEPLGAVVQADAAREQAVAHHVLEHVGLPHAGHVHGPGREVGPPFDIGPCVVDDRGVAGGARRGVQAHHLLHRHREEAVGEMVPQVRLGGEGQARDVRDRGERPGAARAVQVAVVRGVRRPLQGGVQSLELPPLEVAALHGFGCPVPVHRSRPGERFCTTDAGCVESRA